MKLAIIIMLIITLINVLMELYSVYETKKRVSRLEEELAKLKGGLEIMEKRRNNLHEKYQRAVEIDAFLRKGFKDTKLTKLYGDNSWRELNLTLIDDDKELIDFMSDYFERKIDQLIDELEQEVGSTIGFE